MAAGTSRSGRRRARHRLSSTPDEVRCEDDEKACDQRNQPEGGTFPLSLGQEVGSADVEQNPGRDGEHQAERPRR